MLRFRASDFQLNGLGFAGFRIFWFLRVWGFIEGVKFESVRFSGFRLQGFRASGSGLRTGYLVLREALAVKKLGHLNRGVGFRSLGFKALHSKTLLGFRVQRV